jgi:hypothetical protein
MYMNQILNQYSCLQYVTSNGGVFTSTVLTQLPLSEMKHKVLLLWFSGALYTVRHLPPQASPSQVLSVISFMLMLVVLSAGALTRDTRPDERRECMTFQVLTLATQGILTHFSCFHAC